MKPSKSTHSVVRHFIGEEEERTSDITSTIANKHHCGHRRPLGVSSHVRGADTQDSRNSGGICREKLHPRQSSYFLGRVNLRDHKRAS
jgi:hypothetical protein